MMRFLFITLLGFFGPALIMLFLRLLWYRIRYNWLAKRNEPEIIDITPTPSARPSRWFIAVWIVISLMCTGFLLWQMDDTPASDQVYIPAHMDAEGNFIPSQTLVPKE
ncbi:MAG: hypothetical protein Q9M44_06785 [Ghiorsea sp.]|nr:hypothetical protein [Ghiorsea sp.]